jgi:hypothetical protein
MSRRQPAANSLKSRATLLAAVAFIASSCSASVPPQSLAEQGLRGNIVSEGNKYLKLRDFKKTDGRSQDAGGLRTYTMMFAADVEITADALYRVTSDGVAAAIGPATGDHVLAQQYKDLAKEGISAFFYLSQGLRPARSGDVLHLTGSSAFEKRESGWVQVGMEFSASLDSSGRRR